MVKISGLNKLTRTLNDAQKAIAAIDGELGAVNFNPNDPGSIEAAIAQMEAMIDERLGGYASNPIVAPMMEGMKERYRDAIIERAAQARVEGDSDQ
ncbi:MULTISPECIES: hypothetical protein [Sphingobium]|uniref:Uncharacterized protein n=1 Tax=Sphingobium psychrophilum TaxID=2728834 RepID=A0A7X9WZF9_9SPHN|nr:MULTISPECIES: hypothetical protein [Sphingobium]NML12756.1 hypothetical protein [Sphingobium psychrophilum]